MPSNYFNLLNKFTNLSYSLENLAVLLYQEITVMKRFHICTERMIHEDWMRKWEKTSKRGVCVFDSKEVEELC